MSIFSILILASSGIILVMCVVMLAKNDNTYRNHMIIINAIHSYIQHCIITGAIPKVDYMDEESYEKTLFRIWDWGYTRILPPDKLAIIDPFIIPHYERD